MSKITIITGTSSGIGHATAIALADRGVDCIVTLNGNEAGIQALIEEIRQRGRAAFPFHLDVGHSGIFAIFREDVTRILRDECKAERFGYLVKNAGFGAMAPFAETSKDVFDTLHRVILNSPYFRAQALLPPLADGGAIVHVTSDAALPSGLEPGCSAYGTMKGGLAVLNRYMAKELSGRGIRANAVAPGSTRTRIADDANEKHPEVIPPLAAKTALDRLGEPADVGKAIATLLSDDLGWVTGQIIEVSGGYGL